MLFRSDNAFGAVDAGRMMTGGGRKGGVKIQVSVHARLAIT